MERVNPVASLNEEIHYKKTVVERGKVSGMTNILGFQEVRDSLRDVPIPHKTTSVLNSGVPTL